MIYTNKNINLISLIITIIIFSSINIIYLNSRTIIIEKVSQTISNIEKQKNKPKNITKIEKSEENEEKEEKEETPQQQIGEWYIKIPKIDLIAPIEEGTNKEILNKKVGHFEDTNLINGNIGLAAYNKGQEQNYFKNLKKLSINDEIIYTYKDTTKTYIVEKIEIIKKTNWSYLKPTDENKITLITDIENEPEYRRCVQCIELEN